MEDLFLYVTSQSGILAYLIVFGILVACGLGFPLPEDVPLIASGYLVWEGSMGLGMAFFVTMAGVLIGDTMLYIIGRKAGSAILETESVKSFVKPKRVQRVRAYFRKYGDKIVFFARFLVGFRAAAFFTAGTMKMSYVRFISFDALAALLSVPIWIAIGYFLGHKWGMEIEGILKSIAHLKAWFTGACILIVAIVIIRFVVKYRKAKRFTEAKTSPPLN